MDSIPNHVIDTKVVVAGACCLVPYIPWQVSTVVVGQSPHLQGLLLLLLLLHLWLVVPAGAGAGVGHGEHLEGLLLLHCLWLPGAGPPGHEAGGEDGYGR